MYYVPFKWQLPSPAPTSDFRMTVYENAKKRMVPLTYKAYETVLLLKIRKEPFYFAADSTYD
jgi:hypothetical protein